MRERYPRDNTSLTEALVGQALVEYLATQCAACAGIGERMIEDKRIVCEVCQGTRLHRYSDMERSRRMQISYGLTKASAHKLQWLSGVIEGQDSEANRRMAIELERA
jgi:hypothetical protein